MSNTYNAGMSSPIQHLLDMIAQAMDFDIDLSHSASFRMKIESQDGKSCYVDLAPLDQGKPMRRVHRLADALVVPEGGAADFDGAVGTAVMVASTITVTVPTPAEGGAAVPVGSTVYATVTSEGGKPKLLSAVRASDTTITISSPGSGYGALLEAAGVSGDLVAGTVDLALANVAGDRLSAVVVTPGGTPGILSVKRKSDTEVTVESWEADGAESDDTSTVKAYNFGQAAHETSTVRWAVIRP
jgi:hypothetical protein